MKSGNVAERSVGETFGRQNQSLPELHLAPTWLFLKASDDADDISE